MYATVSAGHFPLPDKPTIKASADSSGKKVDVNVHLDHVYIALEPGEARLLAEHLLRAANDADEIQRRLDVVNEAEAVA